MTTNPFLDWAGVVFGVTNEALHVHATGGAGGSTVKTVTLTYSGDNVSTIGIT